MANGFQVADIRGQFNQGQQVAQQQAAQAQQFQQRQAQAERAQQQFTQQQALVPLELQSAQLGVQQQQQTLDARTAEQKNKDLGGFLLRLQNTPDEQKGALLESNITAIQARGGDAAESIAGLELFNAGRIDELNTSADNMLNTLVRQGDITAPASSRIRPTSSQQDFETFKQLNARAIKTGDPIDVQLAKQFGRQSGFDRETPQELADIDVTKESKKALVRQAATASKEAFDGLKGVRKTIANIDDAVKALDSGAATGPIVSKLPSFRQAAIELDNIKGRMGLDVVGATTFGALSESELAFALNVALPDSLEPAALKDWLIKKKDAQTKLSNELRKAASFLGKPGNTIADYVDKQEKENPDVQNLSDEDLFN